MHRQIASISPEAAMRAAGIPTWHAEGCPGIYLPGLGAILDTDLPEPERRAVADAIIAYHLER